MKFFFEFIPLIAFFIALLKFDIYIATAVLMALLPVQIILMKAFKIKVEKTHWITLAVVLIFGAATIFFKNPLFIKWKPTIVNWAFAIAFIVSQFVGQKTLIERMLGKQIELPKAVWQKLNMSWVIFFVGLGVLNLYFAYQFDTVTWAQFKVFGSLILTFIFVIGQGVYMSPYIKNGNEDKSNGDR